MIEYLNTEFKKKIKKTISRNKQRLENEEIVDPDKELEDFSYVSTRYVHVRPLYKKLCSIYKNPINILSSSQENNVDQFFNLSLKQTFQTQKRIYNLHIRYSHSINDKILQKYGVNITDLDIFAGYFEYAQSLKWLNEMVYQARDELEEKFLFYITDIMFYAMASCIGVSVNDRSVKYLTGMCEDYNDYVFCKNYCRLFNLEFSSKESYKHLIQLNSWLSFCNNLKKNEEYHEVMLDWERVLKKGFLYTIYLMDNKEKDEIIYCYISSLTQEQREKINKKKIKTNNDFRKKLFKLSNILFRSTDKFHKEIFKIYKNLVMENFTLEQAKKMLEQKSDTYILDG